MSIVLVRADGGGRVGLGHVRRCLSLSQALVDAGAHVIFAVNRSGRIPELAIQGVDVIVMDDDEVQQLTTTQREASHRRAGLVVVDSYEFASDALALFRVPVAVIVDDPPAVQLAARLLVDSTVSATAKQWSVAPQTRLLLGPDYALLRQDFVISSERQVSPIVRRVLVTTGGTDDQRCCGRLVRAVRSAIATAAIDVIIGPYFPSESIAELQQLGANDSLIQLHRQADVPALIRSADMAVSGGGQTTYELAATGTPTVAVCLAPNQMTNLRGLSERGALVLAGAVGEESIERAVADRVRGLAGSATARRAMSVAARGVVDGRGAYRVANAILAECAKTA